MYRVSKDSPACHSGQPSWRGAACQAFHPCQDAFDAKHFNPSLVFYIFLFALSKMGAGPAGRRLPIVRRFLTFSKVTFSKVTFSKVTFSKVCVHKGLVRKCECSAGLVRSHIGSL